MIATMQVDWRHVHGARDRSAPPAIARRCSVSHAESDGRSSRIRFVVLAWICAAAAIVYIQRTAMGVVKSGMARELTLDDSQLGWIMSSFYWAYALTQIPAGWLGSRIGSRLGLTASVILTSSLCAVLAGANGFWSLILA